MREAVWTLCDNYRFVSFWTKPAIHERRRPGRTLRATRRLATSTPGDAVAGDSALHTCCIVPFGAGATTKTLSLAAVSSSL